MNGGEKVACNSRRRLSRFRTWLVRLAPLLVLACLVFGAYLATIPVATLPPPIPGVRLTPDWTPPLSWEALTPDNAGLHLP